VVALDLNHVRRQRIRAAEATFGFILLIVAKTLRADNPRKNLVDSCRI